VHFGQIQHFFWVLKILKFNTFSVPRGNPVFWWRGRPRLLESWISRPN